MQKRFAAGAAAAILVANKKKPGIARLSLSVG
jgi:hypothetical protein